ncbi:MAG: hypothetical protein ACRQFF_05440 [Sphaerochaeta sp.]
MKKLLTVLAISAIAITSTFAVVANTTSTSNRNIIINGAVAQNDFTFDLVNEDSSVDGLDYIYNEGAAIDLTTTTDTSEFLIQRSSGNENTDSYLKVKIAPSQFEGTVNGKNYETEIVPAVKWVKYENASTQSNYGSILIPYGYKEKTETVAGFTLQIVGNVEIPAASDYSSTITVEYEFDK